LDTKIKLIINSVVIEGKRRFNLYSSGADKSAVHPNLRSAIYAIAIKHGGKEEYDFLKSEWATTSSVDGKEIALRALARIQDTSLLNDYLALLFTQVATQDVHTGAVGLAANPKTRASFWKYIQDNFDPLKERLSANMVVFDRFLKMSLTKFSDRGTERDIAKFFEGRDNRGYDRTLGIVSDTIIGRAAYKERDAAVIKEWLRAHGYA